MKPSHTYCLLSSLSVFVLLILFTACSDDKSTDPGGGSNPDTSNPAIAYVSDADGNSEIYVMDADTTHKTRLTDNDSLDYRPVWSPDGTRIAFVSERIGGQKDIYVMMADGSAQTRLTYDFANDDYPVWSPNGTKMLFETDRDGNTEIYVIDLSTTVKTNLTNNAAYDGQACWSPDGLQIAFISDRVSHAELYVMNSDGSDQRCLTAGSGGTKSYPDWSPVSSAVLFTDAVSAYESHMKWVNPTDSVIQTVSPTPPLMIVFDREEHAEWSPSGDQIVFFSEYELGPAIPYSGVFICNADGSGTIDCTGAGGHVEPHWSPDGTRIYYSGPVRTIAFDADGANGVILIENIAANPMARWRPQ